MGRAWRRVGFCGREAALSAPPASRRPLEVLGTALELCSAALALLLSCHLLLACKAVAPSVNLCTPTSVIYCKSLAAKRPYSIEDTYVSNLQLAFTECYQAPHRAGRLASLCYYQQGTPADGKCKSSSVLKIKDLLNKAACAGLSHVTRQACEQLSGRVPASSLEWKFSQPCAQSLRCLGNKVL